MTVMDGRVRPEDDDGEVSGFETLPVDTDRLPAALPYCSESLISGVYSLPGTSFTTAWPHCMSFASAL